MTRAVKIDAIDMDDGRFKPEWEHIMLKRALFVIEDLTV
jgi:hypothetical protein